jgi:Mg-chelatase subunit ChlD
VKTENAATSNAANNNGIDSETHVIFAIDFSSSMNVGDVQSQNGKLTRWNAVFKCVDSLLDKQLQGQNTVDDDAENRYKCLVSLLIFNNESRVLINRMSLDGDGALVKAALQAAERNNRTRGGTSFSAGFHEASILAAGNNQGVSDNVMVVFLTDGRPGDLRPNPPLDSTYPMQTT